MAKTKPNDDRKRDILKLKDEQAEGKSPKEVADIYKEGDKYYCAECKTELPIHQSCPNCKKEVDWDRWRLELPRS